MRVRSVAAWAAVASALTFGVAACGDDNDDGGSGSGSVSGDTLTIYSSLPLQGDSRPQAESVVNGEKLALEQAGGKVGDFTIKYVSLDDAIAATGKWDPGATSSNARKASQDSTTIAYLGEFNSGASAISIPIINQAGILQVIPVEHRNRPDGPRRRRQGRARQVLPDGQAHLRPRRPVRRHPGRRGDDVHEGRGLHEGLHPERQGGLR